MQRSQRNKLVLACIFTGAAAGLLMQRHAFASSAIKSPFGSLNDGTLVNGVQLTNDSGMSVRIIALGATIQSFLAPNKEHKSEDVVLGFATPQEYLDGSNFLGATVGRFANRLANGQFYLDGKKYNLALNDHGNSLHGGKRGFDKVMWTVDSVENISNPSVTLSYLSRDGEEGYPGNLSVTAKFTLDARNSLTLVYRATTDKATIVNITNHSYFNLTAAASGGTALHDEVQINAAEYLPVDDHLIPTGEIRSVRDTPFDFLTPKPVEKQVRDGHNAQIRAGRGYDHCYVLNGRPGELRWAARVFDPVSGRRLEILTSSPAIQFYSGNFLGATVVEKGGRLVRQGDALVFEPEGYPDAPNHATFPSVRLDPGSVYQNVIVYHFSVSSVGKK
ncbi:MAG: aldose epimerase family protein [Steroidobacteraceae bacterium]